MNRMVLQKRALATRDAHLALLDLKKLVDEAAQTTHSVELEAVGMAIGRPQSRDIRNTLRVVVDSLRSPGFEATLSQVREKLEVVASSETEE